MFFLSLDRQIPEPKPPLRLRNTLSGEIEVFKPLHDGKVLMYNCGPTVYDHQHIGNLKPYIFADILRRTLEYNDLAVKQVINITDVGHLTGDNEGDPNVGEDKLERGAKKRGLKAQELAKEITGEWKSDLEKLDIKTKDIIFTKATDFIPEQIALVQTLEEKGYTYRTNDGIYYDTSRFPRYGKLGNINLEELKAGARVEQGEKLHPTDFALWKFSGKERREQEWKSPWGVGFPGWHLECTAMIFAKLGKQIDIHTGGMDHIPIHHNNEIAQAEAATGKKYVNYWLHSAFITIEGQKISKSLGNTVLLRNIVDRNINPLAYRYLILSAHYRTPINFKWDALEGANTALLKLHRFFLDELPQKSGTIDPKYQRRFMEAINDDLDTPKAIALLFELTRDESISRTDKRATILDFDRVLGLGFIAGKKKMKDMLSVRVLTKESLPAEIQKLVDEREAARKEKKWTEADHLRDQIERKGYSVVDTPKGTTIEKA
jgi:cysteinyl-tRNA synthetase